MDKYFVAVTFGVYVYQLLSLQTSTASSVPHCDSFPVINPQTLTIAEGEPNTLTCITASCLDHITVYFVIPDMQNDIDIVKAIRFDPIRGKVNFTNNNENCSYSIDFHWTQDEQIRRELNSIQCIFLYEGGLQPCRTEIATVIFSDPQTSNCDSSTGISPSNLLLIPQGEASTLSCTALCTDDSDILNVYFIRPGSGEEREDLNILNDFAIKSYISMVNFTFTPEHCSYYLEISWTEDKVIRRELDSLRCIFVYGSTTKICKTAVIQVTFTDTAGGGIEQSEKSTPPPVISLAAASRNHLSRTSLVVFALLTCVFVSLFYRD